MKKKFLINQFVHCKYAVFFSYNKFNMYINYFTMNIFYVTIKILSILKNKNYIINNKSYKYLSHF